MSCREKGCFINVCYYYCYYRYGCCQPTSSTLLGPESVHTDSALYCKLSNPVCLVCLIGVLCLAWILWAVGIVAMKIRVLLWSPRSLTSRHWLQSWTVLLRVKNTTTWTDHQFTLMLNRITCELFNLTHWLRLWTVQHDCVGVLD